MIDISTGGVDSMEDGLSKKDAHHIFHHSLYEDGFLLCFLQDVYSLLARHGPLSEEEEVRDPGGSG